MNIFKKKASFIVVLVLLGLFVTNWWAVVYLGDKTCVVDPLRGTCEENLRYLSVISIHQDMTKFIESNYPNATVLTGFPHSYQLKFPDGGYVKKEIKTIELKEDTYPLGDYKAPPLKDFDLIYYCVGETDSKVLEEIVSLYNLTLIKKIEKNDNVAFLYGKGKETNN